MDVPAELASRPNWVLWSEDKVPLQPSGQKAKPNDPSTWSTLSDVLRVADQFGGRIGFVLDGSGIVGIDLDGAVSPDGEIARWAIEIVQSLNSYCELSPSGLGLHVFALGELPGGRGCKIKVEAEATSHKQPGIEIYDRLRYFTFTGETILCESITLNPAQDAIDRLLAQRNRKEAQHPISVPSQAPLNLDSRISAYMRNVDVSISGQGGHSRAMWAARCLVTGFLLDPETAYHYLAEWNQGCVPPWEEYDLRRKIDQVASIPSDQYQPGWLLSELGPLPESLAHIDISELLAPKPVKPARQATEVSDLPSECLRPPGLISDVIDYNLQTALYPQPELALASALALMSVVVGQKVTDAWRTRPNLYVIGLALAGSGKERGREINKEVLRLSGYEKLCGPERIGSHSGLIREMSESAVKLFQLDEIHRLLETMQNPSKSPHLYSIGTILLQLYTSANSVWVSDALADASKVKRIAYPNCVVYGNAVPTGFWQSLTAESISDGFLARCAVFESPGYVMFQEHPSNEPIPESILKRVRAWRELKTHDGNLANQSPDEGCCPFKVQHTPEAWARSQSHTKEICVRRINEAPEVAALWSRTAERTNKFALLAACSRVTFGGEPVIEIQDMEWAIQLSNWLTRRMLVQAGLHISDGEWDAKRKIVLRAVIESGEILHRDLTRKTQRLTKREREEIIKDLLDGEYIARIDTTQDPRHPRVSYQALVSGLS